MGEIRDFSLGNYANQGDVELQTLRQQYALSKGKSPEEAQAQAQSTGKDKEVIIWLRQAIARNDSFSSSISEQGIERLKGAARQLGVNAEIKEAQQSFFKKALQLFTKETATEARRGLIQQLNSAQTQKLVLFARELGDDKGKMNARQEATFIALLSSTLPKLSQAERREVLQQVLKSTIPQEIANTIDDPVSKRAFQQLCKEAYANGQLHTLIEAMDLPVDKKNEAFTLAKAVVHEQMKHSISQKFSFKAAILGSPETRTQSIKIPAEQGKTDKTESLKFSREIISEAAVDLIQEKLDHSKLVSPDAPFSPLIKVAREISKISIASQLSVSTQEKVKIPIPQSCARNDAAMQKAHEKIYGSGMQQAAVERILSHYVEGGTPGAQTQALAGVHVLLKILQLPPDKITAEQKAVLYDLLAVWGSDPKSYERALLPIAYDRLKQAYEEHSANFPPFPILNTMELPSPESFNHLQLHQLLFDEKPSLDNFARLAALFQQFGVSVIDPVSSEPLSREAQIETLSKRPNSEILQDLLYGQLHGTEGMQITLEAIKRKLPPKAQPPPLKILPVIEEIAAPPEAQSGKQKERIKLTGTVVYPNPPLDARENNPVDAPRDSPRLEEEAAQIPAREAQSNRGTTLYTNPPLDARENAPADAPRESPLLKEEAAQIPAREAQSTRGTTIYTNPPLAARENDPAEAPRESPLLEEEAAQIPAREAQSNRGTALYTNPPVGDMNLTELVEQLLGTEPPPEAEVAPQLGSVSLPKGPVLEPIDLHETNPAKINLPANQGGVRTQYYKKKGNLTEEEKMATEMKKEIHKNAHTIWELTVPGNEMALRALLKKGFAGDTRIVAGLELAKECFNVDDDEYKARMITLLQIEEEVKNQTYTV